MKNFLLKSGLFAIVATVIMTGLLGFYGGYLDDFYYKFTTPKQHSFILGDSKSLTGIHPEIIDENLKGIFELPMFNFSFTMGQAAYGELYLESVKRKLDLKTKKGLFILTVSPWLLSKREKDDFENGIFFEKDMPPYNMHFTDINPNPEYLFKNYNYFHFKAIFRRGSKLHKNGYFEETHIPKDPDVMKKLNSEHEKDMEKKSHQWQNSEYRLNQLNETVKYLQKHGTVVLVRMPNSQNITEIENKYWHNFDADINHIANKNNCTFINYSHDATGFPTFDGVHFDKKTSVAFTKSLCDSIKKHQQ